MTPAIRCSKLNTMAFFDLKYGDKILRLLGGSLPMEMYVISNEEDVITCTVSEGLDDPNTQLKWTFDAASGAEIDDDLGWGPAYGVTGSVLKRMES